MNVQEREFSNQGEHLGMGFDSLKERIYSSSAIDLSKINEEELKRESEKVPLEEYYSFYCIENGKMLSKAFSISASISGDGIGMIGPVPCVMSASIKGDYFSAKQMKEENLNILLTYQLKNTVYRIKNPELSDQAKNILANSPDSKEFRRKFGDEFIVGFRTGAEYTALIEIFGVEKESKEEVYSKINAVLAPLLIMPKGNFSGDFRTEKIESLKEFKSQVICFKKPANLSGHPAINLEQLVHDFADFKASLLERGCVKYATIFSDYDQLVDVQRNILSPDLKRLKSKLKRLERVKIKQKIQLLGVENHLRFEEKNSDLNKELYRLSLVVQKSPEMVVIPRTEGTEERKGRKSEKVV